MKSEAFNKALGAVIRKERLFRGWSLVVLGTKLGFTYQQQQKYEAGTNGYSVQLLLRTAEVFELPITDILEKARINRAVAPREPTHAENDAILAARYVSKIPSEALRRNIIDFARKSAYEEAQS